jgi:ATP/maltotriose-dependent transcriptional regulator MalT
MVWLTEALDRFEGTLAVDGLERASADVVSCIVAAIERTKSRVAWILATRSTTGLPIGTWLAYGDCEFAVDAGDLQFTIEELAEVARGCAPSLDDDDLGEILSLTGGWPAGIRIALHALARTDRRDLQATVREASHRYWSEQVFAAISNDERTLLAFAAALPEIDAGVLERAGCSNALERLEAFRARTGLLQELTSGTYRCTVLFLDFLRHQTALRGTGEREAIHLGAARALEAAGNVEAALTSYVTARSNADTLRVLETSGFDLLERGRGDATASAIRSLDDTTRRTNGRILALRGVLQSLAGNPVRAEVLLRRSIFLSQGDRDLAASITIRLSLVMTNRGAPIADLLLPIANDSTQSASRRGEALSLLAAQRALAGDMNQAREAVERVRKLLSNIDSDSVRAKVLQRIGVAAVYIGETEEAREALVQSAELSMELQLYSLASRAYANLSNLMLHRFDDVGWQLWYAEQASMAALKAGNIFDVETASLQLLDAELRSGRIDRSSTIENQLAEMRAPDQSRAQYLVPSKALRLAWEGEFDRAHAVLTPCWRKLHHELDRVVSGAQCALYLALDRKRQASVTLASEVLSLLKSIDPEGPFCVRSLAMAQLCCAVAEAINGRFMHAERISQRIGASTDDAVAAIMRKIANEFVATIRGGDRHAFGILSPLFEKLVPFGYAHLTQLLERVEKELVAQRSGGKTEQLTRVERAILRLLSEGLSPKEIANRRARSVYTVRTHIANAIWKLRCNGHAQAIAVSRRMGILD